MAAQGNKYTYDGTFEGYLCAVLAALRSGKVPVSISDRRTAGFTDDAINVTTNFKDAQYLYHMISVKSSAEVQQMTADYFLTDSTGLEINLNNYSVKSNGESVPCTPKEVEILYLLASHPGQVFGRDQILEAVWGIDYNGDSRTVDTHIKRIRQKITYNNAPWSIQTIYGIGYKFEVS